MLQQALDQITNRDTKREKKSIDSACGAILTKLNTHTFQNKEEKIKKLLLLGVKKKPLYYTLAQSNLATDPTPLP